MKSEQNIKTQENVDTSGWISITRLRHNNMLHVIKKRYLIKIVSLY